MDMFRYVKGGVDLNIFKLSTLWKIIIRNNSKIIYSINLLIYFSWEGWKSLNQTW